MSEELAQKVVEFIRDNGIPFAEAIWCGTCSDWCSSRQNPKFYDHWNGTNIEIDTRIQGLVIRLKCNVCGQHLVWTELSLIKKFLE